MNDIFNLRRFGLYWCADIKGCIASYGWSLLVLSLTGLITYALTVLHHLVFYQVWQASNDVARFFVFFAVAISLCVTMPVKCYGRITKKHSGSSYIMIPASIVEKCMSMLINCLIIAPLFFLIVFLGIDWFLSIVDNTYGMPLMSDSLLESTFPITIFDALIDFIILISAFLLGGLCFKKGKTAKTFICLIAASIIASLVVLPFLGDLIDSIVSLENPADVPNNLIVYNKFGNLVFIDLIKDIACLAGLATAIFFRLKTITH